MLAAAFFYTTPVVSWLAGTAYIDNIVSMFLTATILTFLKWYKGAASVGWLYISGLLAGLAVASKMNAAFGLFGLIAVVLWNVRRLASWRVALLVLIMATVATPWYALTYHWTGNPVMPMLNGVFKSPLWPPVSTIVSSNNVGIGTSAAAMVRLPFRFTFNTERFGEVSPRGSAGLALLVAFPFCILLALKKGRSERLLIGTTVIYWILWSYTFQYTRYFVHILPLVCVLATATVFYFDSSPFAATVRRLCLACGLIMQFPSTSVLFWNIPGRFRIRRAFALETREHFLDRALTGYAAVRRLNTLIKPGERVIGVDIEQIRLYLHAPLETWPDSTLDSRLRDVIEMPPDESLLAKLRKDGFSYILVTRAALRNPPMWYPYLKPDFLTRFATTEFMDDDTVLFHLKS
jgi:hypothetical protein